MRAHRLSTKSCNCRLQSSISDGEAVERHGETGERRRRKRRGTVHLPFLIELAEVHLPVAVEVQTRDDIMTVCGARVGPEPVLVGPAPVDCPTNANSADIPSRVEKRDQDELLRHNFRPRTLRSVNPRKAGGAARRSSTPSQKTVEVYGFVELLSASQLLKVRSCSWWWEKIIREDSRFIM